MANVTDEQEAVRKVFVLNAGEYIGANLCKRFGASESEKFEVYGTLEGRAKPHWVNKVVETTPDALKKAFLECELTVLDCLGNMDGAEALLESISGIKEVEDEIKAARSIREENQRVSELAQITAERDEARVQVVLANAAASRKHLGGGAASGFLAGNLETIKQSEVAAKAEVAEALRREAAAVEAAAKWEATALEALAKADEAMAAAAAQQQQQQQATVGTHKWEDDASAMAVAEKMREERDRAREDAVIARLTASRANANDSWPFFSVAQSAASTPGGHSPSPSSPLS